ncbi:MAG: serine/threonine protein kinase [Planctomycetes bacterium]|nr:serine/threonine protein kinase [Planctomycetota bacterium]
MSATPSEHLFVEFLRQGAGADFEAFCAEHPADATGLRALHGAYERVLEQMRAAGVTSVRASFVSASSLMGSGSAASGELLRRIAAQGPKGSRYRLRGELARGGMGAILRVWDEDLGRELAMKVVLGSDGQRASSSTPPVDGRTVARFLEEAQITGQLEHPCVVPVHELGLDGEGQVYFTMRLVHGRDLGRIFHLARTGAEGWTRTRALGVLLRVCEAMAYAHSKGVVHRDLKPANVMVGAFGEVYVMDWGLARVLGKPDELATGARDDPDSSAVRTARRAEREGGSESSLVTMEGDVIGTPAYMPLEQARGKLEEVTRRSDVYAIGAMLYHLFAGDGPYTRPGVKLTGREILTLVLAGPPRPIRELCPDLPAELEAICEKAMAREKPARYRDTLELAEDLRAFLEGRVVRAYQTGAVVELKKWVARNRPLAAAGVLAILSLVAGLAMSLRLKSIADENAALASKEAAEARRQETLAETRRAEADASARRATAVRDFLAGMLRSANPVRMASADVKVSAVLDDAVTRLDGGEFASDPKSEYALRCTLGDTYQGLGRFEESERQYQRAEVILHAADDADARARVVLAIDYGDTLNSRGKFSEAEAKLRGALAEIAAAGSELDAEHARALQTLCVSRYNLGATDEAIELCTQALDERIQSFGEDNDRVAILRVKLAFFQQQKGLVDEPLAHLEKALPVLRVGPVHARFEAAAALRQRADVYRDQRRRKEARDDLVEALALREAMTGPDSLFTADVMHDLATVELELGAVDDAEEHARHALDVRRAGLGDHRDTATALNTMGSVLQARGKRAEAREHVEAALAMRRRVLPEGNAGLGDCYDRLGGLARDDGDLDGAKRWYGEAVANWERTLGQEHLDLARARADLGKVLRLQGDFAGARTLVESALRVFVAKLGATNPGSNDLRDQLITITLAQEDWPAAETLLRESIALYERTGKPGSPLVAYTGAQLGIALTGLGRMDEAEPLLLAGWAAIGENPKFWAVNKLVILDGLIVLYTLRGDTDSADAYREKAAALRK